MTLSKLAVTWRDSAEYEEARTGRIFNHRRPDRYPRGIVEATSVQDVVSAVQLANKLKVRVSVRSGGHSWAAWSLRDDAMLIDLGKLRFLEYNEATSIAKVSPSTTGRMLNGYLDDKGKMFAGGHCPDVGLGGFLLQGGMGWNCKNWGWACEQLIGIDVVTAEGKALFSDKDQNSDLFWAARGAGPGFPAIITAFYLKTRDAFHAMKSSTFIYPIENYEMVMNWTIKAAEDCDDSVEAVAVAIIDSSTKKPAIMSHWVTFQGTEELALSSLKHINDGRPPGAVMESINKTTSIQSEYVDQCMANPEGHRYVCDNAYINNDADVAAVLKEGFTTLPEGSKAFSLYFSMNPCSRRPLPDMALSLQSDHYFALYTVWENEKDDDRCKEWVKNVMAGVERHSVGAYLGDSDFQVRRTRFWEDSQAEKLMQIRRTWDPKGIFCGYLDEGDKSGTTGLENVHEWHKEL